MIDTDLETIASLGLIGLFVARVLIGLYMQYFG